MRKGFWVLAVFLAAVGAWAQPQAFQVQDATGKRVEVRSIERIVSLDGITTEILFALGVGNKVVGRDDSSYYPPRVTQLPSVGYQFRLSAEGILSLRPTLVIGREDVRPPQVLEQLRAAGITVVLVPTEATVEGAKRKIRTVAQAGGRRKGVRLWSRPWSGISWPCGPTKPSGPPRVRCGAFSSTPAAPRPPSSAGRGAPLWG